MRNLKNILSIGIGLSLLILGSGLHAGTNCVGDSTNLKNCSTSPDVNGSKLFDLKDFRVVMPGVLYRGGATYNGEQRGLNEKQRKILCEAGIGSSYYLYKKPIETKSVSCSNGKTMDYSASDYVSGARKVNQRVYETIHNNAPPVFIHCWWGIHATGYVAATALIQFCGYTNDEAVEYWKVGIAKSIQYLDVINKILKFERDPNINLTGAEQERVCPLNPFRK